MTPALFAVIGEVATSYRLDPWLVRAQIGIESGGDPWAWRYEEHYHYLWDVSKHGPFRSTAPGTPPEDFPCLAGAPYQEWIGQKCSWGLMQIMGAVAREAGFDGPYLPAICDPPVNLHLGCGLLSQLIQFYGGDVAQSLGAYNAGKGGSLSPQGQAYAAKVLLRKARIAGTTSV